jgi:hypothetical protein
VIALRDLATEGGGAAVRDRTQRALLYRGQPLACDERRGVRPHDVGELDPGRPPRAVRGCVHGLDARDVGSVE